MIIEGIQGGFFPRPAALSDLQTLKTAHQGGGTFTYYGAKATTKELADIRGSSFDWVTNATAQNGIKYHELTDYGLDATTNAALVQSLNPSDYVFTTSGLTANSSRLLAVSNGSGLVYQTDQTPDATTSYSLGPITATTTPYTTHTVGFSNTTSIDPTSSTDLGTLSNFNIANDDAADDVDITINFYGGEQLSHVALSGGDLSTNTGYSYKQTAGDTTASDLTDDIWTLSLNIDAGQPAKSTSVADNSNTEVLGMVLFTIDSDAVGTDNDFGGSVFRTDAWWNDIGGLNPSYKFSDKCPGINLSGTNGETIDFDFYLTKSYLERTFSTDFDTVDGGFANTGLSEVTDSNAGTGTYIDVSKDGATSALKLPVSISDVSATTGGTPGMGLYKVEFSNNSWSEANTSLVYGPAITAPTPTPTPTPLCSCPLPLLAHSHSCSCSCSTLHSCSCSTTCSCSPQLLLLRRQRPQLR